MLLKFGLMHQARRLFARAAQDQAAAGLLCTASARLSRACRPVASIAVMFRRRRTMTGGNFGMLLDHFVDFVRRSKQKRAVDAENGDVRGNFLVLQDVHMPFAEIFVGDLRDRRGVRDFADVDQRREDHSGFDRHRQIGEHRQQRT